MSNTRAGPVAMYMKPSKDSASEWTDNNTKLAAVAIVSTDRKIRHFRYILVMFFHCFSALPLSWWVG